MFNLCARRFAASVSLATLGAVLAQPALAATTEGVRQEDSGTIAINLYEVADADPPAVFGTTTTTSNPGGLATATAWVTCALSATCPNPGALEQFASGADEASNSIVIGGLQRIEAIAQAEGETATAVAFIDTAIAQLTVSGGKAANDFEVSGTLEVAASADAFASEGDAVAVAVVSHAIQIQAIGETAAEVEFDNSGTITLGAIANAQATGGGTTDDASAYALIIGLTANASATGAGDGALAALDNDGSINVFADAHASADGAARATATALYGMGARAIAFDDGDATALLTNSGDVSVAADAVATGGHAATAIAISVGGLVAIASGQGVGDVTVDVVNEGDVLVSADAHAVADTNALAIAIGVTGIYDIAHAATGDVLVSLDNLGTVSVLANAAATGLVAQATALAGGALFAGGIYQSAAAMNGSAHGVLNNSGDILVAAFAEANGSVIAYANAYGGPGVNQFVFATGGDAISDLTNSGSITLLADADAVATNSAYANAFFFNALVHSAFGAAGGDAVVNMDNGGTVAVGAFAHAAADNFAAALASATNNIGQVGFAFDGGDAMLDLFNDGIMDVLVGASATGASAFATAAIEKGLFQTAVAIFDGSAAANMVNEGEVTIQAAAEANGSTGTAVAIATVFNAVFQTAVAVAASTPDFAAGNATATFSNEGTIEIGAFAAATGGPVGYAEATLSGGIVQSAAAGVGAPADAANPDLLASVNLSNGGEIALAAGATAAGSIATAGAMIIAGVSQIAVAWTGEAEALIDNDGSITLGVAADASGADFARADGVIYGGFFQSVDGLNGDALAEFVNGGTFELGASARAESETIAIANAQAYGGGQEVLAGGDGNSAIAAFVNSGDFVIHAFAEAVVAPTDANTAFTFANAAAHATGLRQYSNQGSVSFDNSGSVDIRAFAESTGPSANGFAVASGVIQQVGGTDGAVSFANDGEFLVAAGLEAVGEEGYGFVIASGYRASGQALEVDVANGGTMTVAAFLELPSGGTAAAVGIDLDAAVGTTVTDVAALLSGTLSNSGELNVLASAIGGTVTTFTATGTAQVPGSRAVATGIALDSGVNTMTVNNSGAINVDAVTANGGAAEAVGIRVAGNGTGSAPPSDAVFTFTNDGGTIVVRESVDGGESWRRGMAIDVASAPNASVINLIGDGAIYGNIAIAEGDEIRVADGTTYFDGIINPQFLPADGLDEDDLDIGLAGVGSLIIGDGGNLVLADPRLTGNPDMYDGPAYALVDTLTVESDGTLTFELQPEEGGVQPVGSYSQVFANTANLDGTLVAELTVPGGLIDDSYSYDNVIDADVRSGQFDQCLIGGTYADSLLVGIECSYDNQANVDLTIERVAFDAVAALNGNGVSVGFGLECIYDVSLTGGIVDMLADLFLFTDPVNYNIALNQLSGSVYANYLQSFPSLGVHHNDILAKATDCEIPALAGSVLECRASSGLHLWGQADYQWRKADGDEEAGTAKSKRGSLVVGLDTNVGAAGIVGGSIGYVTNNVHDNQFGDDADAGGFQVGAYGVYDPGTFYVKGMATYSWYDGDSDRTINFAGLAPGATFASSPEGDPDVTMWTFGLHGGARFALGENSVLTPYLNWDYVSAKLKSFQETGGGGADLSVYGGKAKHHFLTAGVKWATQMGGVVPEVNLGYRNRFGDRRSDFSAAFLDDRDCEFDIISAAQSRGTFLAGLSVGGKFGAVDMRIGYEGEFNSDVTSHAGNFKFVLPLGGKKVAAAAPAPVLAPPMPPAEVAPAPVEVPPPPPPPSSGERGK